MDFIMSHMTMIVFSILFVLGVVFLVLFLRDYWIHRHALETETKWGTTCTIGFTTNFIDAMGIGSFAPITALVKIFKQCRDKHIPGVLNVGLTIPVIVEGMIFIKEVEVQPLTLFSMLLAAAVGAYIGAGIVSKFSEQRIRLIVGVALMITAVMMILGMANLIPAGGTATGLAGWKLIVAVGCNFILGALMTAGIGLYAPCMALVYFMGMNPLIAFPLMMGSSAVLMPVASVRFIKEGTYNRKAAMAIMVSGIAGVVIATQLVIGLPMEALRILVLCVVVYTSLSMLYSYHKGKSEPETAEGDCFQKDNGLDEVSNAVPAHGGNASL